MKDLHNNIKLVQSLAPAARTATADGTAVDVSQYGSVEMVIDTGTQAGTSNTFKFQHGDASDGSDAADIPAAQLLGAATATDGDPLVITTSNDVATHERGYIGIKRYVRVISSAVSSGNLPCSAFVILGNPRHAPQ